jgi:hypothetical protein
MNMNRYHLLGGAAFAGLLAAPTSAQFGNEWVSFQNDTTARVSADPLLSTSDPEEKDYASADLDQDGWIDLVAVRKTPGTTAGPRINVLFMNENGVLVDRTVSYATATDVAGDQGFKTATNDRDVKVADFDNDGWLDLVTAPALGFGLSKAISHPRLYMNQGATGGAWNGLRFEDVRFPQLFVGSTPTAPDFCGAAPGDIDEDGDQDLHFTDYDASAGPDTNDRLLINDGFGFFADESALRMSPTMLSSGFATSSYIVELNGLPGADVVKNEAGLGEAIYNNPSSVGFYNILDDFQQTQAYFVSQGDLNNDGRIDTVFSDDSQDRYRYNLSTDVLGRVVWGANKTFTFLTGGDDGFGAGSIIADLDGDSWKDVIICDVDVDVPSCNGRIHIYHNPGGPVGSEITLREEAGGSGAADWKGAKGLVVTDLKGGYDVAVFDLDNDGDQDLILGRCAGMSVWMNQTFEPFCQKDLGFGGPSASLTACGAELSTGGSSTLAVEASSANAPGAFAVGNVSNPTYVPLLDATIVPWLPVITVPFQTDATGTFTVSVQGGAGPATWYVQAVVFDPLEPTGFATTNALEVALLP